MKGELRRAIDGRPGAVLRAGVAAAPSSGGGPMTASDVAIVDAGGYFDAVEVESALQEIGAGLALLEDAIANLEGGDTLARTGFTMFSHGTPLALSLQVHGTVITVREDIFALHETLAVSNTAGQVEWMRVTSAATPIVGPGGAPCYQYNVTRRVATSPTGVLVGWAQGTLVNGATDRGYILIDNRGKLAQSSPQLSAVRWLDSPPLTSERVFRLGNLYGAAGVTGQDFGFAVGNLTANDMYLLFNSSQQSLRLHNADFTVLDPASGANAVRIYGKGDGERLAGDYTFGATAGVHNDFFGGDGGRWTIYRGAQPIIDINGEASYLAGMFTIGEGMGARVELGEQDGRAMFLLRNGMGEVKVALTTDAAEDVYAHIGNPAPQRNRMTFDGATGRLTVDGDVLMDNATIYGILTISDDGRMEFADPDDPKRKGVINRHGVRGYSVDALGQQYLSSVDAWSPLTLENRPGSGVWKTWKAGEMMRGDPDYRHLRVERGANGRIGLFDGETPKVFLDYDGKGYFTGEIEATGGVFSGAVRITTGSLETDSVAITQTGVVFDASIATFDGDSFRWRYNGVDYLRLGTIYELPVVTGAVIDSPETMLRISAADEIMLYPGAGKCVVIGGQLQLPQVAAAAAVNRTLYEDSGDGHLYYKDSAGTAHKLT